MRDLGGAFLLKLSIKCNVKARTIMPTLKTSSKEVVEKFGIAYSRLNTINQYQENEILSPKLMCQFKQQALLCIYVDVREQISAIR